MFSTPLPEQSLNVQGREFPSIFEFDGAFQCRIPGNIPDRFHRFLQRNVGDGIAILQHREDEDGRADFQECGKFRHVGIPKDDVQSAELFRVGMGFVTRVDDAS